MPDPSLYRKPYGVAGIFFVTGLAMIIAGMILVQQEMDWAALIPSGLLVSIGGAVIFFKFRAQAKRYRSLFTEEPLLRYTMSDENKRKAAEKNIEEIRGQNKTLLLIMLFFCVVFAVLMPLLVEEKLLMVLIFVGLAAVLSLAAWLITSYRVCKQRRASGEVILARHGVFAGGDFHCWEMPGASLRTVEYKPPGKKEDLEGVLRLGYRVAAYPASNQQTVILLIPPEYDARMPAVLRALRQSPQAGSRSRRIPTTRGPTPAAKTQESAEQSSGGFKLPSDL